MRHAARERSSPSPGQRTREALIRGVREKGADGASSRSSSSLDSISDRWLLEDESERVTRPAGDRGYCPCLFVAAVCGQQVHSRGRTRETATVCALRAYVAVGAVVQLGASCACEPRARPLCQQHG